MNRLLGHSDEICRRRMLKVLASESTVLFLIEVGCQCNIPMTDEELETMDELRFLEVKFSKDGNGEAKIKSRVLQGRNTGSVLKALKVG